LINVLAGLAFIDELHKPYFYSTLEKLNTVFFSGLDRIIKAHDLNIVAPHYGPRFNIIFGRREPATRYDELSVSKAETMYEFLRGTYNRGVYFQDYGGGPSHHGYSIQHTQEDLEKVLNVMEDVFKDMKQKGLI
jgi:glutamate-1-semialdehyde aminotransferase